MSCYGIRREHREILMINYEEEDDDFFIVVVVAAYLVKNGRVNNFLFFLVISIWNGK
jgi:hypothetical protein